MKPIIYLSLFILLLISPFIAANAATTETITTKVTTIKAPAACPTMHYKHHKRYHHYRSCRYYGDCYRYRDESYPWRKHPDDNTADFMQYNSDDDRIIDTHPCVASEDPASCSPQSSSCY